MFVCILVLCILQYASCILNSPGSFKDITQDPNFNCAWLGGITSKLECNCLTGTEEFIFREDSISPHEVNTINITNCGKIIVEKNAIRDMRNLRHLNLENIGSIILRTDSIYWIGYIRIMENIVDFDPSVPSISFRVYKSNVKEIAHNAIKGRINSIEFIESTIELITPFGISNLQLNSQIVIDGSQIGDMKPQSFKKFATNRLLVRNTFFRSIPSRAFYEINVRNQFQLDNITVLDAIKPYGFIITDPQSFTVTNSRINMLSGEGFKVHTRGDVLVQNNVFNSTGVGAFRAITYENEAKSSMATFHFDRNSFNSLSKDALAVDSDTFNILITRLQINEMCECNNIDRYFRNGENTLEVSCFDENNDWITVENFKSTYCSIVDTKTGIAFVIGLTSIVVLVLGLSGLAAYFWRMNRSKSYGNNSKDLNGKLSMIVPDGRTYRETELHVIVERSDLLTTDL